MVITLNMRVDINEAKARFRNDYIVMRENKIYMGKRHKDKKEYVFEVIAICSEFEEAKKYVKEIGKKNVKIVIGNNARFLKFKPFKEFY